MREINRQLQEQRRLANKRCIEEDKERRTVRVVEYARADGLHLSSARQGNVPLLCAA